MPRNVLTIGISLLSVAGSLFVVGVKPSLALTPAEAMARRQAMEAKWIADIDRRLDIVQQHRLYYQLLQAEHKAEAEVKKAMPNGGNSGTALARAKMISNRELQLKTAIGSSVRLSIGELNYVEVLGAKNRWPEPKP